MNKRATLADIAHELSVSKTLVSLVLNGKGVKHHISPITRKRVEETALKRNYIPLQSARNLRTGKSGIIGLVVPSISDPFFAAIVEKIEQKLTKASLRLFINTSADDSAREKNQVELLLQYNVDGIIVATSMEDSTYYEQLYKSGKPVILIDRVFEKSTLPSVQTNNYEATQEALYKLTKKGYKNILFLSPNIPCSPLQERLQAYKDMQHEGLINPMDEIAINSDNLSCEVRTALDNYIRNTKSKKVVFTTTDKLALEVLTYCKKERLSIPTDLAVWSFDDTVTFKVCTPAISGISQPAANMGETAIDLMLEMLETPGLRPDKKIVLPAQVEERESV